MMALGEGRKMTQVPSDEEVGRQILDVFLRHKVCAGGTIRRNRFIEVRDGDFQRGIDAAVKNGWIQRHHRDRYQYILAAAGREAYKAVLIPKVVPVSLADLAHAPVYPPAG